MSRLMIPFLMLFAFSGFTQESNLGNWLIYIGNKKIDSKWNWHHEVQYRNYNAIGDLEQLLLRTGLGYNIADNTNFLMGYGFINSQNYIANTDEKSGIDEHRVFQQLITRQKIGKVKLQHRYRFEQRWVASSDFKVRFRYFLSINVPFKQESKWYFSAYNEVFINTKAFDRNRLYTGIGHALNDKLKFEVGYMNQFLRNSNRDQINLITFFSF